ncbi:Tfp pilus assembly protein PilN [Oxalobacteraceae bacterium GrIS 1.11]
MTRMRIDFARPSLWRTLYHVHPAAWAGAALGLALCVSAALAGYQLLEQQRGRAAQALLARARQAARQVVPATVAKVPIEPARAAAVNAAILQLNLPWRDVQDAVAAATPATVALLALEPDARKHALKIGAETKTSEAMIAYIEALKEQEFFTSVVLSRHEINEQDPNRPIRFQIEAQWAAQ